MKRCPEVPREKVIKVLRGLKIQPDPHITGRREIPMAVLHSLGLALECRGLITRREFIARVKHH